MEDEPMSTHATVPAGYHSVQPYLIFIDASAAMDFYKRAFNATERLCMKDPTGRVVHAELVIGDSCIMLAEENPNFEAYSPSYYHGSPISLMLYVADCDVTYKTAIEAGASSKREPVDQPYGDRSAGVVDPFGYSWYLATHLHDMSKEELEDMMKHPAPTPA
jgi:PhnB protein